VQVIEGQLIALIQSLFDSVGWFGVFVAMTIESACIPLPSEVTMPLAGWMLVKNKGLGLDWVLIAGLLGAVGNLAGSLIAYGVGAWGGRPFLLKYGKYMLISRHDIDLADTWFNRYGELTVFATRLLPVVRTFISFPAGVTRMNLAKFSVYTFLGALPWSAALAYAGFVAGEYWESIRAVMRPFDVPIILVCVALFGLFVYRKIKAGREE
jgi:membrane protein DedA with SNARE-associated domain